MEEYKDVSESIRRVLEELGAEYREVDGWFEVSGTTRRGTISLAEEIKRALEEKGISVPVTIKKRRRIYIPKYIKNWAELKILSGSDFYAGDILICVSDNLYKVKDELRKRGFWWNGKAWCRNVSPDVFEEELDRIRREISEILSRYGIVLKQKEPPPLYKEALIKRAKRYREASEEGLERIISALGDLGREFEEYVNKGDLKVVAYEPRIVKVYPTRFLEKEDWGKINRMLKSIGCRWWIGLGRKGHWECMIR